VVPAKRIIDRIRHVRKELILSPAFRRYRDGKPDDVLPEGKIRCSRQSRMILPLAVRRRSVAGSVCPTGNTPSRRPRLHPAILRRQCTRNGMVFNPIPPRTVNVEEKRGGEKRSGPRSSFCGPLVLGNGSGERSSLRENKWYRRRGSTA
jgi:hypothetical protein